jgi:hypothetical protein
MAQPPLYKYLDVQGAKLTLENKCFRHSKPSYFNDTEDFTVWPAPGSADTELGVFMGPEVSHGETKVYTGVQA